MNYEKNLIVINESKRKKRDASVDLLRILACLIVVCVHTNDLAVISLDKSRIFWAVIFGDGVTIFFLIMGFFLFRGKTLKQLLKKYIISIAIPALVLMIVSEATMPLLKNQMDIKTWMTNCSVNLLEIIRGFFHLNATSTTGHIWYVFSYLKVLLFSPILNAIVKNKKTTYYVIAINLAMLIFKDMKIFFNLNYNVDFFYLLDVSLLLVLIGNEIYQRKEKLKSNRKIALISAILLVFLEIIRLIAQYKLYERGLNNNQFITWHSSFACVGATLISMIFLSISIKNEKIQNIISYIGERTFVVYLIHPMIIQYFNSHGFLGYLMRKLGCTYDNLITMPLKIEATFIWARIILVFLTSMIIASFLHEIKKIIMLCFKKMKTK